MRPVHEISAGQWIAERLRLRAWRFLTRNAPGVFLRGGDLITTQVMLGGLHEPQVTGLLKVAARDGFGDFLLDVGANIGLVSFQCARDFSEIECFEPNPDVFKVLSVNCKATGRDDIRLNEFGIGDADESVTLSVPIGNYGGAFIRGRGNRYSDDLLASKDGFDRLEGANYRGVPIRIRDGRRVFAEIFEGLSSRRRTSGVVKIDVEGYEESVLKALGSALPADFHVVVVFENLDPTFSASRMVAVFPRQGHLYKLDTNLHGRRGIAKVARLLVSGRRWSLSSDLGDPVGDLVYSTRPLT